MNPSSSEIVSLFTQALACPSEAERSALLEEACRGNAELRQQIESLLSAHRQAGGFLEPPPAPGHDPQQTVLAAGYTAGAVIGQRYKLLEEIAEGGMGTVWLAEQTHPVRRRVAVKLIKPGMDSKQVLSRFEAERQALAVMDHPHIAKVLDGGVTEQGRPYFVMEYVKGVPITQFCDQARLNVEQRLKLMTQVCQAVQHAHQKGIIHRDLKPSNILVCLYDGQPVPKVIDFGLAKALHQPLTEGTVFTSHGLMVGTPLYMSPEQAEFNNLDIDTRSDVYSLGVILYELLTGSTPLDQQRFKDAAIQEIVRLIKEEEPSKPSTKLSGSVALPAIAAQRSLEPQQLSRLMQGDLDWIVMKSLDKERSRRYETATGLAKDIERYLTDLPIEACPPSTAYKFRKFARRNRLMLGATGGIAAALILGTTVSTFLLFKALKAEDDAELARENEAKLRIQAEHDRDEAVRQTEIANQARQNEQAALTLAEERLEEAEDQRDAARHQSQLALSTLTRIIEDMQASLKDIPGSGDVRRRLLATSLEKLEQVASEYVEQAAVDRNAMNALLAMGDVVMQFGVSEEVEGLSLNTGEDDATELTADQRSAVVLAQQFYTRARNIAQDLAANDPNDVDAQLDLASAYEKLGNVSQQLGNTQEAHLLYQQLNGICKELAAGDPANVEVQRALSISFLKLGDVSVQLGNGQDAVLNYQQYHDIAKGLATAEPDNLVLQRDLASSYEKQGDMSRYLNNPGGAREFYQRFQEIAERLHAVDPTSIQAQSDLALSYDKLGRLSLELGDFHDALVHYQRFQGFAEVLATENEGNVLAQRMLSTAYERLGDANFQMRNHLEALAFYGLENSILETLAAADPTNVRARQDLSKSYFKLGDASYLVGNTREALEYYEQFHEITKSLAAADAANADVQLSLAVSHYKFGQVAVLDGDFEEALPHLTAAVDALNDMIENGQMVEQSTQLRSEWNRQLDLVRAAADEARMALTDWDTFISQPEHESMLAYRIELLARAGRFDEIPQTAERLRSLAVADPAADSVGGFFSALLGQPPAADKSTNLYNAACGYALCANAIVAAEGESLTEEQQTQRQEYIDLALACLGESIAAGWSDFDHMQQDPDLAVLRELPEFEELMQANPMPPAE